jgi:hypothetical protein
MIVAPSEYARGMTDQPPTDGDNAPERAAEAFYRALAIDGEERALMGGYWLPQWTVLFDKEAMLRDFAELDRPRLRDRLQGAPEHPGVRYAAIVEGDEPTTRAELWEQTVSRYITFVWEPTLQFWAVAHYGLEYIDPKELPV